MIHPFRPDPLGVKLHRKSPRVDLAYVPTAIVVSLTALKRAERSLTRLSSLFVRIGARIRRPFQLERIGHHGEPEHYVGAGRWRR